MKIKLHHVNVCSKDVPGLADFYRDVLDLQPEPSLRRAASSTRTAIPAGCVPLRRRNPIPSGREGLRHQLPHRAGLNPVERGHIAFRTDDIAAFKKRIIEDVVERDGPRALERHTGVQMVAAVFANTG